MKKETIVIGFLGSQLDSGHGSGRWEKWRPSVSVVQQDDVVVSRFELLHSLQHERLAKSVANDIRSVSPETQVNCVLIDLQDPWDFGQVYAALYDWVRAYSFDLEREQYWTHITTGTHVAQICMFLLVESRLMPGQLLQTSPPSRQKQGAIGNVALIDLDLSKYDVLAQRFAQERRESQAFLKSGIATKNAAFNALIDELERVAVRSKTPILLTGPTGAGKSHLARRMYELKKSRHQLVGPFVEVNCATLTGDGAASTLFGHKKGSFTGAVVDRAGLLRTADKGILFLDEIGELGLDEQAMLLKAIEEKKFFPLGGDQELASDFQLIAGTNRDLRESVSRGLFREDLYARINIWSYVLPGLSQRPEDIEPNIDFVLQQSAAELGMAVRFNVEARAHYVRFAQAKNSKWSGNFRDLSASVTRLMTLAEGGRITVEQVNAEIKRLEWQWQREPANGSKDDISSVMLNDFIQPELLTQMDLFDQLQLQSVIKVCQDSRTLAQAGRTLFSYSRQQRSVTNDSDRLRKFLARFNLTWDQIQAYNERK